MVIGESGPQVKTKRHFFEQIENAGGIECFLMQQEKRS